MNRLRAMPIVAVFLIIGSPGCARNATEGGAVTAIKDSSRLTPAEMEGAKPQGNAYDFIRRLRPGWGADRRATSFRGSGSTLICVDGGPLQSLDTLDQLAASQLKEVRLLSAPEAAQRFGNSSNGSKVILVTLK